MILLYVHEVVKQGVDATCQANGIRSAMRYVFPEMRQEQKQKMQDAIEDRVCVKSMRQ